MDFVLVYDQCLPNTGRWEWISPLSGTSRAEHTDLFRGGDYGLMGCQGVLYDCSLGLHEQTHSYLREGTNDRLLVLKVLPFSSSVLKDKPRHDSAEVH